MLTKIAAETDNYFTHDADIGIIGVGDTLEQAFITAAKSMFAIITDLSQVQLKQTVLIQFTETNIELALVTWLNLLIANAQSQNLVFADFRLTKVADVWTGEAQGETWRNDLPRGVEVKGATLTMLSVKPINKHWEARCVIDV